MKVHVLVSVMVMMGAARQTAGWGRGSSSTLQVLQRLANDGHTLPIRVKQDNTRPGESPIYYLRLPSSSYYYTDDSASATVPLPAHHKVNVNFMINGRPGKVYHWSSPFTTHHSQPRQPPHYLPLPPTSPPPPSQPSPHPPHLPSKTIAPAPATPPLKHSKVVLKKKFPFNGKPSKVYVWRQGSPLTVANHRRARHPFRF